MIPQRGGKYKQVNLRKAKKRDAEPLSDCRQKAILPRRGRIALSANERIAEFLDFAIQSNTTLNLKDIQMCQNML